MLFALAAVGGTDEDHNLQLQAHFIGITHKWQTPGDRYHAFLFQEGVVRTTRFEQQSDQLVALMTNAMLALRTNTCHCRHAFQLAGVSYSAEPPMGILSPHGGTDTLQRLDVRRWKRKQQ